MKKYFFLILLLIFVGCDKNNKSLYSDNVTSNTDNTTSNTDSTNTSNNDTSTSSCSANCPEVSTIIATTPTAGLIVVTFDKNMNVSTLNNTNITLEDGSNNSEGTFSQDNATQISFTAIGLVANKIYTLSISTSTQDSDNNSFASQYTKKFYSDGEVIYGTVTSPHGTGEVWFDRNLGAKQICSKSRDDATESYNDTTYKASQGNCFGDYYQWGRNRDGHEKYASGTTATLASGTLTPGHSNFITNTVSPNDWTDIDATGSSRQIEWSKIDGTSVCPTGFRVPTTTEIKADTSDEDVSNRNDAFNNFLKLPAAGFKNYDATDDGSDPTKYSYTRTVETNTAFRWHFRANTINAGISGLRSVAGIPIRCLKE